MPNGYVDTTTLTVVNSISPTSGGPFDSLGVHGEGRVRTRQHDRCSMRSSKMWPTAIDPC